ncbi:MAG: hypothetical protein ABFQ65_03340 [Nanoarchaeota archaeon]
MSTLNCLICKEKLYSEIGFGCKMCGMPLENSAEKFCCMNCENKYDNINKTGGNN